MWQKGFAMIRPSRLPLASFSRGPRALLRDRAGGVAVLFSLVAPVLLLSVGVAIDYARLVGTKSSLQTLADGAALAGAQALRLANASQATVQQAASSFVAARTVGRGQSVSVTTSLTSANTVVAVEVSETAQSVTGGLAPLLNMHVTTRAQARTVGNSLPVCMAGLDPAQSKTLSVDIARVNAPGCQVISDSTATDSVAIANGAQFQTGRLCSSGGATNDPTSSYAPAPQTDCPSYNDPLASLAPPTVGSCTYNNMKITSGSQSLSPGVYCGGLTIGGGVSVNLLAGTYVIKNGPLTIKSGGGMSGTDISFYLTGSNAQLDVQNGSTISLTAPATGPMAGVLIYEDRNATLHNTHKFESRDAPTMLGTIYLPRGDLEIGVKGGNGGAGVAIGSSSAWTVILARTISVSDNQQLTLNTNYNATNVKPPAGLGPNTASAQLIQ